MKKIKVSVLNPEAIKEAEKMMIFTARLTQRGHALENESDVIDLFNKPYSESLVGSMCALPHPTIQKFGVINVVVTGASRRFLAQITRHQNEVKFMSASLQYSDYSGKGDFCVPLEVMREGKTEEYINTCTEAMTKYAEFAKIVGNDEAGYLAPQGLRNILVISATLYQWKHMIKQRICNRNTTEMQYVMTLIWNELYKESVMFYDCCPDCCSEGKMTCGHHMLGMTPTDILNEKFYDLI